MPAENPLKGPDEEFKHGDTHEENTLEISPYLPASWKEIEEEDSDIARKAIPL